MYERTLVGERLTADRAEHGSQGLQRIASDIPISNVPQIEIHNHYDIGLDSSLYSNHSQCKAHVSLLGEPALDRADEQTKRAADNTSCRDRGAAPLPSRVSSLQHKQILLWCEGRAHTMVVYRGEEGGGDWEKGKGRTGD